MAVVIRLSRGGAKNRPFYKLVVADKRYPRDGRFIDKLGTYDPLLPKDNKDRFKFDAEKVKLWLSKGAQPSLVLAKLLTKAGIESPIIAKTLKHNAESIKKKLVLQKQKADAEAKKAAKEAAKAAKAAAASAAPAPAEAAPAAEPAAPQA